MWAAEQPALILAALWLLGITAAFCLVDERRVRGLVGRSQHILLLLIVVTLVARLVPLILLPMGAAYDIESFRLVGDALLRGEDIYRSAAAGRHPYLPFQLYWIGAATYLARSSSLPFVIWIKLPAVLADMFIVTAIFRSFRQENEEAPAAAALALLYALNPIPILVAAYHGQFDALPVLLLLLAWHSWRFGRRIMRSALTLGFAILSKTWPVVFLPIALIRLAKWRDRLLYTSLSVAIPVLFTAAYLVLFDADPVPILRRSLTHAGVPGYWGLSALLYFLNERVLDVQQVLTYAIPLQRYVVLGAGLFALWWTRKQEALNALLTTMLTIFAVMLGMGLQWLLWPIAFAIVAYEKKWLKWYTMTGALMMFVHLYGLHLYPWLGEWAAPAAVTTILRLISLPVWAVIVLWVWQRLRVARRTARQHGKQAAETK